MSSFRADTEFAATIVLKMAKKKFLKAFKLQFPNIRAGSSIDELLKAARQFQSRNPAFEKILVRSSYRGAPERFFKKYLK